MRRGRPERVGVLAALALAAAALTLAGCGSSEPRAVPNVTGLSLDLAQARLDAHGIGYSTSGGGIFGVLVRSHWQVCEQVPSAGRLATEVTLVVERSCSWIHATHPGVVPDVEYARLDEAQDELLRAGLGFSVASDDTVAVRSHWTVCDQTPGPGEWGRVVELEVGRDCWDW